MIDKVAVFLPLLLFAEEKYEDGEVTGEEEEKEENKRRGCCVGLPFITLAAFSPLLLHTEQDDHEKEDEDGEKEDENEEKEENKRRGEAIFHHLLRYLALSRHRLLLRSGDKTRKKERRSRVGDPVSGCLPSPPSPPPVHSISPSPTAITVGE